MRPSGSSASRNAAAAMLSISTRKLKSRYGSWRTLGIVGHLQVREVAVGGEIVADRPRAPLALVRAPGQAGFEGGLLLAGEEECGAIEEHADVAAGREELESPEELQPIDPAFAAEAGERGVEADAHRVGRAVAEVLEHEEEQAAVELDVEQDVRLSRDGSGHARSLPGSLARVDGEEALPWRQPEDRARPASAG